MYVEGTLYPSMFPLEKKKNKPHHLRLCKFMINITACFTMGKAHVWGTFPDCEVKLGYCLVLGPLFWEWPPPLTFSLPQKFQLIFTKKYNCPRIIMYACAY
jgi:hypothetical protein